MILFQTPSTTLFLKVSPRISFLGTDWDILSPPHSLPSTLLFLILLSSTSTARTGNPIFPLIGEEALEPFGEENKGGGEALVGSSGSEECLPKKAEMKAYSVSALSARTSEIERNRASGDGL